MVQDRRSADVISVHATEHAAGLACVRENAAYKAAWPRDGNNDVYEVCWMETEDAPDRVLRAIYTWCSMAAACQQVQDMWSPWQHPPTQPRWFGDTDPVAIADRLSVIDKGVASKRVREEFEAASRSSPPAPPPKR